MIEIIINVLFAVCFIGVCCYMISEGINRQLQKELKCQKDLNKQVISLYQNEQSRTDTLFAILKYIKNQLTVLESPKASQDELQAVIYELVNWIEQIIMIEGNQDVYKQI